MERHPELLTQKTELLEKKNKLLEQKTLEQAALEEELNNAIEMLEMFVLGLAERGGQAKSKPMNRRCIIICICITC